MVDLGGYLVIPIPGTDTSVKINGEVFLGLGAEFSIGPNRLKIGLDARSYTFEIIQ